MSIALGNKKPEQLLEVEKIIWHVLLTLSEGTTAPEEILRDLVVRIPWHSLQPQLLTISNEDCEWFKIDVIPMSASSVPGDTSPGQAPVPMASSLPDNSTMDQTLDFPLQPPTDNLMQEMQAGSSESALGCAAINQDTPMDGDDENEQDEALTSR